MSSIVWTAQERISSPGHWRSRRISPSGFRPRSPQENFFGVTFHSISAVDLLIYDFSVHMVLTIYTPELRYSSNHWMTKYLAINPSNDNKWCAIMSTPSSLLAFSHRKALFRFNGTPWIFFNHPVLSIIRFSCQLIFNKILYTESVERKPLPACAHQAFARFARFVLEKATAVIWRSEKGKKVEEWTDSKLRSLSWSFVPAATCACSQPLTNIGALILAFLGKSCDNRKPCFVL